MEEKYNSGLMSQSFWFLEFKKAVILINQGDSLNDIKQKCIEENLFGAVNPCREKRMCGYILTRIKKLDKELVEIFVNSNSETQRLINLIMIMKSNRLFFEFVYEVYRNKLILGDDLLKLSDVKIFFSQKESLNDDIAAWKDTTKNKLMSLFLNFLSEANLLKEGNNKSEKIMNRVLVDVTLENYLKKNCINIYKAIQGVN